MQSKLDITLKRIKSEELNEVYVFVTNIATEFAIAGFIDKANHLLAKLWSLEFKHSKDTWLNDEGFQILWILTGKTPEHIPFQIKTIANIQIENWWRLFYPAWVGNGKFIKRFDEKKWTELSDHELFYKALELAYEENNRDNLSNETQQLESLKALDKYLSKTKNDTTALCCASILAARNGMIDQAKKYIVMWGEYHNSKEIDFTVTYLMREISTAKILLSGILAPVLGLTDDSCDRDLQEIIIALDERASKGQSIAYEKLNWKELLSEISIKVINQNEYNFNEERIISKWLGFNPATDFEIEQAEGRLKTKLPKEYKDFLLTTNGFLEYSTRGVNITSLDKVDWLINIDKDWIDAYVEPLQGEYEDFASSLKKSLMISEMGEQILLLIPSEKDSDWECWLFGNWIPGEMKYRNLRYYIENDLLDFEESEYINS